MEYNTKEYIEDIITREQLQELEHELQQYDDITEMVLKHFKIQSLSEMHKSKFLLSIKRIRDIKQFRNDQK